MSIFPSHVLFRHSKPPSNVIFPPGLMFDSVLLSSIPLLYNFQSPPLIVPVGCFDLQWKFGGDHRIESCCSRMKNSFNKVLDRLNDGETMKSNEAINPSAGGMQQVPEKWNGSSEREQNWQNLRRKRWKGWGRTWRRLPENNRHLWKCDVCDVIMNGVKQVLDHLRGRTHARKSCQSFRRRDVRRQTGLTATSSSSSSVGGEGNDQFLAEGKSQKFEAHSQTWSPVNSDTPIRICCFPNRRSSVRLDNLRDKLSRGSWKNCGQEIDGLR